MTGKSQWRSPTFRLLQVCVVAVIGYFLVRYLLELNWGSFFSRLAGASPASLALSMLATVAGGLLVALGWSLILRILGQRVPHPVAVRVYYLSELAKYVPGKIWTALGRAVLLEPWGVPKVVTISTVGIMLIVLSSSGVTAAVLSLPFWPSLELRGVSPWLYPLVLALLPVGLAALHPRVFDPVLNWFLRKVEKVSEPVHLAYGSTVLLVLYWTGLWLIKGTATWILLDAIFVIPHPPPLPWLILSGVMAVSWIVGVISPFTPAGLGIAELSIALMLPVIFGLDQPSAAAFAFLCRLWALLADLLCVGVALALPGGKKGKG